MTIGERTQTDAMTVVPAADWPRGEWPDAVSPRSGTRDRVNMQRASRLYLLRNVEFPPPAQMPMTWLWDDEDGRS